MSAETGQPLTVGDLRRAMANCEDDEQVVVMQHGHEDVAVFDAFGSYLIPWEHDCTDIEGEHRPGRDCPAAAAFELHIQPISEFEDFPPASPEPGDSEAQT